MSRRRVSRKSKIFGDFMPDESRGQKCWALMVLAGINNPRLGGLRLVCDL